MYLVDVDIRIRGIYYLGMYLGDTIYTCTSVYLLCSLYPQFMTWEHSSLI